MRECDIIRKQTSRQHKEYLNVLSTAFESRRLGAGLSVPCWVRRVGLVLPVERGLLGAPDHRSTPGAPGNLVARDRLSARDLGVGASRTRRYAGRFSAGVPPRSRLRCAVPLRRVHAHGSTLPRAAMGPSSQRGAWPGALSDDAAAHLAFRRVASEVAGAGSLGTTRQRRPMGPVGRVDPATGIARPDRQPRRAARRKKSANKDANGDVCETLVKLRSRRNPRRRSWLLRTSSCWPAQASSARFTSWEAP